MGETDACMRNGPTTVAWHGRVANAPTALIPHAPLQRSSHHLAESLPNRKEAPESGVIHCIKMVVQVNVVDKRTLT